jgi:hypothetical protein
MLLDRFPPQPQPGEIWEISGDRFSAGEAVPTIVADVEATHYVQIIREPQPEQPDFCSVMLLSIETEYLSNVDILIPPAISGLDRDILAETWNVRSISIHRWRSKVGKRLSRQIYDLLLSIGDVGCGLRAEMPTVKDIRKLGLLILPDRTRTNDPQITEFHHRERVLLASLNPTALVGEASPLENRVTKIIDRVLEIEREFITSKRAQTSLSAWLRQQIDPVWQDASNFDRRGTIPVRGENDEREIMQTIALIVNSNNEDIRRKLLYKLGSIGSDNEAAIQTLVDVIQTTTNDETLWVAIESLRRVSPRHPSAGIERLKSIDLGDERVIFIVNIVPKPEARLGILLQVYPELSNAFVPLNLKLILQDENDNSLREITARAGDECLQLKLSGKPREIFNVCLELNGVESIEDFVI